MVDDAAEDGAAGAAVADAAGVGGARAAPPIGRIAAVDLPSLGLQLLCQDHPDWRDVPAATVDLDKPEGRVLEVNAAARAAGVLPGMRFGAALALTSSLRAGVVDAARIDAAIEQLRVVLRGFSPRIEAAAEELGTFWLDATGLERLWPSLEVWAHALRAALERAGWVAVIAVAPSRFGAYALARAAARRHGGVLVVLDSAQERRALDAVPLDRLHLQGKVRDALARLGVHRLGELLALPADGVRRRFGVEALRLWRMAAGDWRPALRPDAEVLPIAGRRELDDEAESTTTVLFLVKQALPRLLAALAARHERLSRLLLTLDLAPVWQGHDEAPTLADPRLARRVRRQAPQPHASPPLAPPAAAPSAGPPPRELQIEVAVAEPTLDEAVILDLLRLRLERVELPAGVLGLGVDAEGVPARHEQLGLAIGACRRDLRAAAAAIARVRAELGDDRVVRARLCDSHLPEASFAWQTTIEVAAPRPGALEPTAAGLRTLVRRIRDTPELLPPQPRHVRDDGWLVRGLDHGAVVRSFGPYVVESGWWHDEVQREYQFAELGRGEMLWIYFDRSTRRWYLQGSVE